ncbi:MAG: hypothetical protein E7126_05115 [Rikenellaceae bacterium]|nr:hypothetical protein [Rikenellaceae bacterium]
MKRLFTIITLVVAVLFASCNKEQQAVQHLFVTDTILEAGAKGETVTVSYNLVASVDGEAVKTAIVSGDEMLGNITQPAVGIIRIEVKANSGDKREAIVEISYINETTSVIIEQAAGNGNTGGNGGNNDGEQVTFKALCLDGYYYGQKYGEGADRYAFFLSDQGLNNAGQAYTNGTYYYIDAFAPVTGSTTIPNGMYMFDSKNSGAPNTINSENSQLFLTGESVEDTVIKYLDNATMMVSDNKIVLEVVIDGQTHKVTYNGGLELEDATEDNGGGGNDDPVGGQDKEAKTTLTGDHNVAFDGEHRVKWVYEGDYWQTGYSNYTIMMMNKYNGYVYGDTLQLDIITDNTSQDGDFYGTYECSYTAGKGVMMAGFTNDYAMAVGSWLFDYVNGGGAYNGYAMIIDGSLTISDAGNGNSTIVLDAYDCLGNNITCNWTGVIEED